MTSRAMTSPSAIQVTADIQLRPWGMADAAKYVRLVHENLESLNPVASWATDAFNVEDFKRWVQSVDFLLDWKFAIVQGEEPIGSLSANSSGVNCVELSFWLSESERGRGVLGLCIAAIEPRLKAASILCVEIHAQATNESSRKVAQRAGYTLSRQYCDRPSRPGIWHVVFTKQL